MALTQGDIAFTSFNADEDGWSIVTFVDIDPNTTIYFSDSTAASPTAIGSNESSFVWNTGSQKIAAGTVVRFSAIDSTNRASSIGTFTVVNSSDLGLNTTDETVYAFLGNSATAPTTILTAVSSEANNNSLTTVGLTDGVNAIKLTSSTDYGQYTGSRTGQTSFVSYKALVNNSANWTIDTEGNGATIVPNTTNLAIASGNPTVNLSLNTNSGTEAGTTQIIVTATASSAVSSNQTVNLGVTGTGITTSDYNLSNSIITIPSGQTAGSVTFSVVDDAVVEGAETATLTISNPSSGITLGTTSQNITIADNDIAAFPTVNLSLSTTAGSEANTTATIVTATASSAVAANQTVNLGVTGTGITTSDYNLSNNIITIPSGQTSGSVIFSVVNDVVIEGTETATLTISNPSSGITLGTTSQNFAIADNNIAGFPIITVSSNNTGPATTIFGNGGTTTPITVLDNNTISNLVSNAPTILQNSTITSSTGQSTITTNNLENLNTGSDLTKFNNSIVVNSLTGSNLVVGTDASENINGSPGNDYLDGKGNNDTLRGGDGNDTILGGLGSDNLFGGKGNDHLIGWGGGSGEIDLLNGNQGADTYVLGDASSVFYASSGNGDYANIASFKAKDQIELKGLANNYSLGPASAVSDNKSAVGIFTSNGTELIAVVQDGLKLNTNLATDTGFVFV